MRIHARGSDEAAVVVRILDVQSPTKLTLLVSDVRLTISITHFLLATALNPLAT